MKTILLLLAALALWQHWDKIDRWLNPPQAGNASGEIVLYATAWCGYCAKTRELFAEDGVAYREVDIEKDSAGRARYQALGCLLYTSQPPRRENAGCAHDSTARSGCRCWRSGPGCPDAGTCACAPSPAGRR